MDRSRWRLAGLRQGCDWLKTCTLAGIWQLLEPFDIHYQRGREYLHRPDPNYDPKVAGVRHCLERAGRHPEAYAVLFQDELTYHRQPTLACADEEAGSSQALAQRSYRSNTRRRITVTVDALTGRSSISSAARSESKPW